MKRTATITMLLVIAVFVGCTKEQLKTDTPDNSPLEITKVNYITLQKDFFQEEYNAETNKWDTTRAEHGETDYYFYSFKWDGNRLDHLVNHSYVRAFSYDLYGRLNRIDFSIGYSDPSYITVIEYNDEGLMSRCTEYVSGDIYRTNDFSYSAGRLQTIVTTCANNSIYDKYKRYYQWDGDNVVSVGTVTIKHDGSSDTTYHYYEYDNEINPFYGIQYLMIPDNFIFQNNDCIAGLNKNRMILCNRTSENIIQTYHYYNQFYGSELADTYVKETTVRTQNRENSRSTQQYTYHISYLD